MGGFTHPEAQIGKNTAASHLCRPSTPHMVLCYEGLNGMGWNDTPRIRYYQK